MASSEESGVFEEAVKIMNSYDKKFCATLVSVTTHIPFYLTGVSNLEEKVTKLMNAREQIYVETAHVEVITDGKTPSKVVENIMSI